MMNKLNKRLLIVAGHYGTGKTNIAINVALDLANVGEKITLVDLDIVNPYFRAADAKQELEQAGGTLIAPVYANTNLDIPALPPAIRRVFTEDGGKAVFDVGGDDAGAIALGQYAADFLYWGYEFYYVINARRKLTETPEECVELLREIEQASRLKATGIINNTNLGRETTVQIVEESDPFAQEVAKLSGLPLITTTAISGIAEELDLPAVTPIKLYTKTYWEEN